jgi:hypothetical protein
VNRLAAPALLLLLTTAFYWKLVLTGQFTWLDSPDTVNQIMPWLQAEGRQWQQHTFPLWDPHEGIGLPFVGQVQPGALNPFNWILFSIPRSHGFISIPVLHWYYVLLHFAGALSCFLLCRDLSRSRAAAVIAGCAYGLGGYLGTNGFPQMMWPAVWLPIVLLFLLRAFRDRQPLSAGAISGAVLGLSLWGTHHNVPTFTAVVVTGFWIYYVAIFWKRRSWPSLNPPAAFFLCLALVAAVQALPSNEFGQLTLRWVGAATPLGWDQKVPYTVHSQLTQPPSVLLGIVIPGFQRSVSIFAGLTVFSLALIGAWRGWRRRTVRLIVAFALSGVTLALGSSSLFHGIVYAVVPMVEKARTAHMASALFSLGVATLAAFGFDWMLSAAKAARVAATTWMVRLLAALGLFLYAFLMIARTVRPETSQEYFFPSLAALAAILLSALLFSWGRGYLSNRTATVATVALILFELNGVSNVFGPRDGLRGMNKLRQHAEIAAFLKSRPELVRLEAYDETNLPYNFGDWYDLDEVDGDVPTALKTFADVQFDPRVRMLFSANYYAGANAIRPDQREVFKSQSGLRVFRNPAALPRARIVHEVRSVAGETAMRSAILDGSVDFARVVLLERENPQLETCAAADSVEIKQYQPDRVTIHVDMQCRGMLILSDAWYPGWRATVDGNPVEIHRAYGLFRGIVAEQGPHEIVMTYRPLSVYLGAALSSIGFLLCAVLFFRERHAIAVPR